MFIKKRKGEKRKEIGIGDGEFYRAWTSLGIFSYDKCLECLFSSKVNSEEFSQLSGSDYAKSNL